MSTSCDTSHIHENNKNRIWRTVLIVVLAVCALPVLLPLAVCL